MDEIDANTCVLEPEMPSRDATRRRIALGTTAFYCNLATLFDFYTCMLCRLLAFMIYNQIVNTFSTYSSN